MCVHKYSSCTGTSVPAASSGGALGGGGAAAGERWGRVELERRGWRDACSTCLVVRCPLPVPPGTRSRYAPARDALWRRPPQPHGLARAQERWAAHGALPALRARLALGLVPRGPRGRVRDLLWRFRSGSAARGVFGLCGMRKGWACGSGAGFEEACKQATQRAVLVGTVTGEDHLGTRRAARLTIERAGRQRAKSAGAAEGDAVLRRLMVTPRRGPSRLDSHVAVQYAGRRAHRAYTSAVGAAVRVQYPRYSTSVAARGRAMTAGSR